MLDALFTPFPPVRSLISLLRRVGLAGGVDLARLATLPVRRLAAELSRQVHADLELMRRAGRTGDGTIPELN